MDNKKTVKEHNIFDQLLYVRLTEACNLSCDHCFIPAQPNKMNRDQCLDIPRVIREISNVGDKIIIQWHGGEPTSFPKLTLTESLEAIESQVADRDITHSIQTNLMNYDKEWLSIYRKYFNNRIGVSWDFNIRKFKGSIDKYNETFIKNIKQAADDGVKVDLTVTITKPLIEYFFEDPWRFFQNLEKFRVSSLHFEKLTKSGRAVDNWEMLSVSNRDYSEFLSAVFLFYRNWMGDNKEHFDGISPIDDYLKDINDLVCGDGKVEPRGCTSGICDTRFHTIDHNGYTFGCTAITSQPKSTIVETFGVELVSPDAFKEARKKRVANCGECYFKPICNSGCIISPEVDHSGECNGSFILRENLLKVIKND